MGEPSSDPQCDGHVVVLPDPDTPSGYPDCPCKAQQDTPLCEGCSALVMAVEAKRPCPDGGLHYGDNIWYPMVCVHRDSQHLYVAAVSRGPREPRLCRWCEMDHPSGTPCPDVADDWRTP